MIVMIILLTLLAIGIILTTILLRKSDGDPDDEAFALSALLSALVTILIALACAGGGISCFSANYSTAVPTKEYELSETIKLYQHDRQIIESYHPVTSGDKTTLTSDITFEVISTGDYYNLVKGYNHEIFEFKCYVKEQQYKRNNPWVSWFVNKAYMSISEETLSQLEYTLGK